MDFVLIWCFNTKTLQMNTFIVDKGTPGLITKAITQKVAARAFINADIKLNNVKVHESQRLKIDGAFSETVKQLFVQSRLFVSWIACGLAVGCYDHMVNYLHTRK